MTIILTIPQKLLPGVILFLVSRESRILFVNIHFLCRFLCFFTYLHDIKYSKCNYFWLSCLQLENTPTSSLQMRKTIPMRVLDMTLNNLIVRLR